MTTWFVSRHPGALAWMKENKISFDIHAPHLNTDDIKVGDTVIGSLPINLAADVCERGARYINLSLNLAANQRGKELSAEELKQCEAILESFEIKRVK